MGSTAADGLDDASREPVSAFTFFLHDAARAIPSFEIELFQRDEDAVGHGRSLIGGRRRYTSVEVWHEARQIARLNRGLS